LKNDVDAEGRRMTAELVSDAEHGTLALATDGTFTYTPDAEFVGTDTFTYRAFDGNSQSNIATATITVQRFNTAPYAVDDIYYTAVNTTREALAAEGVLRNDGDDEEDLLTSELIDEPSHGELIFATDGSFTYTPDIGFVGMDTFTYRAKDYALSSTIATVRIQIAVPVDQPIARDDSYTLNEDSTLTTDAHNDVRFGMVNEWKFDEASGNTAFDSVGDNNATLFQWTAGQDKWVPGKVGGALDFNNATHYARTDAGIALDQYTISFWLRLDAFTGVTPRIAGPTGSHWLLVNNESARGVGFYFDGGSNLANDPARPLIDVWEHYAVAFDRVGSFARVYRNGLLVGQGVTVREEKLGAWVFGHNENPNAQLDGLNGALDELRIYNRLLSTSEIASLSHVPGPLANDTAAYAPADVLGAQFEVVSEPTHGTLEWQPSGAFSYTPDEEFSGGDSFEYRITYDGELSNVATVTLQVRPVDDPPIAAPEAFKFSQRGQPWIAAAPGVLQNDHDIDSPTLTAVKFTNPQRGSVALSAEPR